MAGPQRRGSGAGGGSLVDRGGQNPIEAVRQGSVVLVGPHWQNFADAYDALIKHDGARVVHSAQEIADAARKLLSDEIFSKIDYKNPQVLRAFVTDRGKMIPRRISGASARQQRVISTAIRRARMLALLPFSVTGD